MEIDINTLRGLGTLFALIAFISVCLWAYSGKRKASFEKAAQLPFADEELNAPLNAPLNASIQTHNPNQAGGE